MTYYLLKVEDGEPSLVKFDGAPPAPSTPSFVPEGYKLTFEDNFEGDTRIDNAWAPVPAKGASWQDAWARWPEGWQIRHLQGNNDKGLKKYVAGKTHENTGNSLILRAYGPEVAQDERGRRFPARAGMISSERMFDQELGYFEHRTRFSKLAPGTHFAVWLLPAADKWPPEVDFPEAVSIDDALYFNSHGLDGPAITKNSDYNREDWNVYGFLWERDKLTWTVNGEIVRQHKATLRGPQYFLASWEVGGSWPGPTDDSSPWEATAEMDYVRIYAKD